jgi:hypothetical protein
VAPNLLRSIRLEVEESHEADWRRLTGEEYSTESIVRRIHPDDLSRVTRAWVRAQGTGRFRQSYRLLSHDGHYIHVLGCVVRIGILGEWGGRILEVEQGRDFTHRCEELGCYCRAMQFAKN